MSSAGRNSDAIVSHAERQLRAGRAREAAELLADAVVAEPGKLELKTRLAALLRDTEIEDFSAALKQAVAICAADANVFSQPMQRVWLTMVTKDPEFGALARISACDSYEAFAANAEEIEFRALLSSPPLLAGLPVYFAADSGLERALTFVRRYFLERPAEVSTDLSMNFIAALGLHCFHNEYVFAETPREQDLVAALRRAIEAGPAPADRAQVALYSCYAPLYRLQNAVALLRLEGPSAPGLWRELLARQIAEPLRETDLAGAIEAMTPINSPVSKSVKAHYEDNPYPRWRSLPRAKRSPSQSAKTPRRAILDAGCGTGLSALSTAAAFPDAVVTAIDLSLTSLAYAKRKAEEFAIGNIRFAQADILELGAWHENFDFIVSGGVIHHLETPADGLRALRDRLRPDGAMVIALYSEAARQDVAAARARIDEEGLSASADDIRQFRARIIAADPSDPLQSLLARNDFYSLSNCRDLLFHEMERRFTCARIGDLLAAAGLKFLGFQALRPRIIRAFSKAFPADPKMISLKNWAQIEAAHPHAFRGMYHVACCRKGERPHDDLPSWLDGRDSRSG